MKNKQKCYKISSNQKLKILVNTKVALKIMKKAKCISLPPSINNKMHLIATSIYNLKSNK